MTDSRKKDFFCFCFLALVAGNVIAQDTEPRSYSVVPKGLHAAALSYTYSFGDVISNAASPLQNLDVKTSVIGLGYVQTFGLFNKLARVMAVLPYGFLNGSAKFYHQDTSGSRTGFYDGVIKLGINLIGSPVLSPKEFQRFEEHTVFGFSVVVSVPIGQYYIEKLINLGSNRWGFKPELGLSHRQGRWFYEIYTGVWMFTSNSQYLKSGNLEQKALFSFQSHVDYVFKSNSWLAFNAGFGLGGETTLNSLDRNDEQENLRLGATFSMPIINKKQSIKFSINTGVATKAGQNYTAFTLIYQYSWF